MYVNFGEAMVTKSVFTKAAGVPGRQSHCFQINHLRELQLRLSLRIRESVQSSVLQFGSNTKQGFEKNHDFLLLMRPPLLFLKVGFRPDATCIPVFARSAVSLLFSSSPPPRRKYNRQLRTNLNAAPQNPDSDLGFSNDHLLRHGRRCAEPLRAGHYNWKKMDPRHLVTDRRLPKKKKVKRFSWQRWNCKLGVKFGR